MGEFIFGCIAGWFLRGAFGKPEMGQPEGEWQFDPNALTSQGSLIWVPYEEE